MKDYSELKKLAEAFPADLDFDSNNETFFNGPSGESLGGGSTGFYSVYGKPFLIEGDEYEYDGPTYVEFCNADFAKFMVDARDGVLELIAEVERLEGKNANQCASIREYQDLVMGGDVSLGMLKADLRVTTDERDQLKSEVERLNDEYDKAWRHDMNDKNNVQALAAEVISLSKDAARFRFIEQDASSGMSNIYGDEWVSVIDSIINEDNNK